MPSALACQLDQKTQILSAHDVSAKIKTCYTNGRCFVESVLPDFEVVFFQKINNELETKIKIIPLQE